MFLQINVPVIVSFRAFQSLNYVVEACQRRGADMLERIAVIFQNIFDTVKVLEPIRSIKFNLIQKNTLHEVKTNIDHVFYSNDTFS